jgi:hypothetical protein
LPKLPLNRRITGASSSSNGRKISSIASRNRESSSDSREASSGGPGGGKDSPAVVRPPLADSAVLAGATSAGTDSATTGNVLPPKSPTARAFARARAKAEALAASEAAAKAKPAVSVGGVVATRHAGGVWGPGYSQNTSRQPAPPHACELRERRASALCGGGAVCTGARPNQKQVPCRSRPRRSEMRPARNKKSSAGVCSSGWSATAASTQPGFSSTSSVHS